MVTDEFKTKAYGRSCFHTLALGSLTIAYDVDQYGSGILPVGMAVPVTRLVGNGAPHQNY
jgi:hypothetical protein